MKNLFRALLIAATMLVSVSAMAQDSAITSPPATACFATQQDFMASAANVNAKVYTASDKARDVIVGKINEARRSAHLWDFEVDKLSIGIFTKDGVMYIGTVMFKDGCVVPGSVKVFPADLYIAFLIENGLSMDDFAQERSS